MLEFHNGYAADQTGVRVAAQDDGRRILFRVEKCMAIKALGLQPDSRASFETLMDERVVDVRRACGHAYHAGSTLDHLTLIRLEPHHFGHC